MAASSPRFSFTAGSLGADSDSPASAPVRFVVERSLDVPIDCLRVDLGASGGAAVGDDVTLDLGVGDAGLERVFTGSVAELRPRLGGCRLFCVGMMLALVDLRVASFYQETSAGDVVRDLLGQAALDAGDISDGVTLPRYAVERRVGAHAQLRRLAERLGFSLFADRQGKVHFKGLGAAAALGSGGIGGALAGAASSLLEGGTTTLEYGKHLLAAEGSLRPPLARTIVVGGESPTSGQGEDKSFWLTAKDSDYEDSAGSGDDWLITDTAARTKDMAGRFAAGYAASFGRRTTAVRASVLGNATLELGDAWGLSGAPEEGLNRSGMVAGLRHRFGAQEGFVTDLVLAVEEASS
ncbi:hypothetical protein ACG04R_20645 [Roseateles sp. BYS78W]|uniref:Phage late control D family protein n=1 Tax=Pelomonas candidula TaxID=3299025 RepID=A0ABW7HGR4_9BURK